MLQHERDQKVRLEKMVEQLARQHSHLEEAAQHALPIVCQPEVPRPSRNVETFIFIAFFYFLTTLHVDNAAFLFLWKQSRMVQNRLVLSI